MAATKAVLLAVVASLCLASQAASAAFMNGVPELVNVTGLARYINQTLDACDIINSEYLIAQNIYTQGKNSRNNAGVLRIMNAFANRNFSGEAWYDQGVSYFGFPNFVDFLLGRAINGQWPYDVSRGARQRSIFMYAIGYNFFYTMHEIDAGRNRVVAGNFAQAAAEAEDALAVIWGGELGNFCSPPHILYDVSKWSCTMTNRTSGTSVILNSLVIAYKNLQTSAKANSSSGYEAARMQVFNTLTAGMLQWVHRSAFAAQKSKDIDTYRANAALARAAFNIVAPYISSLSPTSAAAFNTATEFDTTTIDKAILSKARAAITAFAPSIGYTYKTIYAC